MKNITALMMIVSLLIGALSGCSTRSDSAVEDNALISPSVSEPIPTSAAVDIDLTALSSTMVYGEVYNIMLNPEEYMGQTIKMTGLYYSNYNPELDIYYHFIIVEDATACCAQGLEFIWSGEHAYPEDYPAEEAPIEVAGVWESYEEGGITYYYVSTDFITLL